MRGRRTLLLVALMVAVSLLPTTSALAAPSGMITVTASVDGTGTPISKLAFSLERVDGGPWTATTTETAPGVYEIADLTPGEYRVLAIHGDNTYVPEWFEDVPMWDESSASPVLVTDGGNAPISMGMARAGALLGTVQDDNTGIGIPGITVSAFDSAGYQLGFAESDSAGAWMVEGLPAGDVFINFQHASGWYREELWEDEYIFADATPLTVVAGSEWDIGIAKLEQVGTVSGRVTEDGTGAGALGTWVLAYDDTNTNVSLTTADSFGDYTLPNVPPGNIRIKFESSDDWNLLTEWYDDQPDFASATVVTVVAGTNTPGIDAVLSAAPANYEIATVSGDARVGEVLTGDVGAWSGTLPIVYTYQWLRCPASGPGCPEVSGAEAITYSPVSADIGSRMVLRVTGTNAFGSTPAVSSPTAVVRDVLPPPFADTEGNVHSAAIERIRDAGITRGCNPPANTEFCPDGDVTRGEMAAFLNRMMDLPATPTDFFTDDDDSVFEDDINRIAAAGITLGCNPPTNDLFCPDGTVTRGQMAAFMSRMLELPPADRDFFTDDDGSIFEDAINRIATAGITMGCNPPVNDNYCPDALVRRDEMATFLSRTLDMIDT